MSTPVVDLAAQAVEAEETALDDLVAGLDELAWARPTPAVGWNVRDQIGHLAVSEEWAALAAQDPDRFAQLLVRIGAELERFFDEVDERIREHDGPAALEWWRERRTATLDAVRVLPEGARIAWFGPPMGARAFLTARLMETWAHGQDVRDALGVKPSVSDRLRDIAHLGVITRAFAYANRGREAPEDPVRVELTGPGGDQWTWGPDDAADRVSGSALDFCLVATQRRSLTESGLVVTGDAASDWMTVIQAFAGPPTDPPAPGRHDL